jgi:hypothetical protein
MQRIPEKLSDGFTTPETVSSLGVEPQQARSCRQMVDGFGKKAFSSFA